jgi:hypothetical protein
MLQPSLLLSAFPFSLIKVYHDIQDEEERQIILKHIAKEAKSFLGHMRLGGRVGMKLLVARPWRKVLSDIDDTLKCSGNHYPAGVDESLPRKAIYPGSTSVGNEKEDGDCDQYGRSS